MILILREMCMFYVLRQIVQGKKNQCKSGEEKKAETAVVEGILHK